MPKKLGSTTSRDYTRSKWLSLNRRNRLNLRSTSGKRKRRILSSLIWIVIRGRLYHLGRKRLHSRCWNPRFYFLRESLKVISQRNRLLPWGGPRVPLSRSRSNRVHLWERKLLQKIVKTPQIRKRSRPKVSTLPPLQQLAQRNLLSRPFLKKPNWINLSYNRRTSKSRLWREQMTQPCHRSISRTRL